MTPEQLRQCIDSNREAVRAISVRGGIAVVVREPTGAARSLLESWGWKGEPVLRLPSDVRKAPQSRMPGAGLALATWIRGRAPKDVLRALVFVGARFWPHEEVPAHLEAERAKLEAAIDGRLHFRVVAHDGTCTYFATLDEADDAKGVAGRLQGFVGSRWLPVARTPTAEEALENWSVGPDASREGH